jgi:methyl-accepting chemotaxis protein
MTIAKRLTVFIALALTLAILTLALNLFQIHQVKNRLDFIGGTVSPALENIARINSDLGEYRRVLTIFYHSAGTPEEQAQNLRGNLAKVSASLNGDFEAYAQIASPGEDKASLEKERELWNQFYDLATTSMKLAGPGEMSPELKDMLVRNKVTGAALIKSLKEHIAFNDQRQKDVQAEAEGALGTLVRNAAILALVTVALLVYFGLTLYQRTVPTLRELSRFIVTVQETRNLTLGSVSGTQDEVGVASRAFNGFLNRLRQDFAELNQASKTVFAAASSLAQNVSEASSSIATQNESAASMAAATEELTVSINHVATRAQDSRAESQNAGHLAISGVEAINTTVRDITQVEAAAQQTALHVKELESRTIKVDEVIRVIRDFADQTNLLALNAAIEAARAGEQGKGFAVVADEVRKLSERTTLATQEISTIIGSIRSGVDEAVGSVSATIGTVQKCVARSMEANETVASINTHVHNAMSMAEEISLALAEQSSAANVIAEQVERVAQMAEETNSSADQTRQSAASLHELADTMHKVVTGYRVS